MKINLGDSAFVMICSALVFLMTPGLALFYGGMVRRKNILNTLMSSFFICGLSSVMWVLVGYSLSFGEDFYGIIGGMNFFGMIGVGAEPSAYAPTIPQYAFCSISNDVCNKCTSTYNWCTSRKNEIFSIIHICSSMVTFSILSNGSYGMGEWGIN